MKFFIKTFGCASNVAESERIEGYYTNRGWTKSRSIKSADEVVIVTCMIRQMAEDRVVGLVHNVSKLKGSGKDIKIIVTGCMTGMAAKDASGKLMRTLKKRMPAVDEFLPIEDIGFSFPQIRSDKSHALVLISNGCNNYCSYCVVPYARGKEASRMFEDIVRECKELAAQGYTSITLLGQNVNSYGSDLVLQKQGTSMQSDEHITYVKHLGKYRIPTLFPHLLKEIASIPGLTSIDFLSSNPWDFSDDLMDVIAENKNINRLIHLPVQSGNNEVLRLMNRWYTREEYLDLVHKIRSKIPDVRFSTDIIVGFPGETEQAFQDTVDLCTAVNFYKAYIAMYSDRPMTYAHKTMSDSLPYQEKKRRWGILEDIVNGPYLASLHITKRKPKNFENR